MSDHVPLTAEDIAILHRRMTSLARAHERAGGKSALGLLAILSRFQSDHRAAFAEPARVSDGMPLQAFAILHAGRDCFMADEVGALAFDNSYLHNVALDAGERVVRVQIIYAGEVTP